MRLHRFYIQTHIEGKEFDISDRELVSQWRNVFRYNVGSQVILFDGSGVDYLCIISSLRNLGATVSVVQKKKNEHMPARSVTVCFALIKKDNFELALQKTTEIGVVKVVPVLCERSEKKNLNMARLQKIAVEASEQSGRGTVPEIGEIIEFAEALQNVPESQTPFFLHPDGEYIGDFLSHEDSKNLTAFIGPEGGFSDEEIKLFASYSIPKVSLGPQILRAETAAVAVASLLLL